MNKKVLLKIAASIIGLAGIAVITATIYPMISYQIKSQQRFTKLLDPLAANLEESERLTGKDYTKLSNWFENERKIDYSIPKVADYTISIPKLRINQAHVRIGGEDLAKSLVQYPGTALPGKPGNTVIFGHSTLPSFYDPKDYISIFSTLPSLDMGDEIEIDYDGVVYRFSIEEMIEVEPSDIQILQQNKADSFITLITCTPPGDPRKPRRLVVRARIDPMHEANANTSN